ncbi:GIY-YIG nuclease family protein [uncultured Aquimonas sp.]|uniref:GIY-YIG nuclease family protein n=1 Tax=uncultured Aquimonas sp. TaxID=385483 RepID=UPI000868801A|nr:GIY-YIG nuclease family protein [uncultured Aquimonas sp.]ODU45303.1 MAG: hypothetical protein ABS96_14685 [Xanthomonadaceae bacterium SCN 69-123]
MNGSESARFRLEHIGFRVVGEWLLEEDTLRCVLTECAASTHILYAFLLEGEVVYVGKTVLPLKRRLYSYQKPGPTQSTNIKGNALVRDALSLGRRVEVLALPDNGLLHYGGFHLNLAAGLEDSLLATLKPAWNRSGV